MKKHYNSVSDPGFGGGAPTSGNGPISIFGKISEKEVRNMGSAHPRSPNVNFENSMNVEFIMF